MKKNKKQGGKREGAGRKKKEPTVVKRIPLSQVKNVENLLKKSNGK